MNHYVVAQHKYTYVNQLYFNLKKKTGGIVTNTKEKKKKGTKWKWEILYNGKTNWGIALDEIISNHIH